MVVVLYSLKKYMFWFVLGEWAVCVAPTLTIVDYHVEVNGDDHFGAVSGGSLKVLARAKPVHGVVVDAELAKKYFGRGLGLVHCGRIIAWAAPDSGWKPEELQAKAVCVFFVTCHFLPGFSGQFVFSSKYFFYV